MQQSPIYTTEPMTTRALAAEIRHDPSRFLDLLRNRGQVTLPDMLERVACEANANVDILLEFSHDDNIYTIGIEAKFNHEIKRDQILREISALDHLFILVSDISVVPRWLKQEFDQVAIIEWKETLQCFPESRLTLSDISTIRTSKVEVESRLNQLNIEAQLPGWDVYTRRNGNGNPAISIQSPPLSDGRTLRGQIQVVRGPLPIQIDDTKFESHIGISVFVNEEDYYNPETLDVAPTWICHLNTLRNKVLESEGTRLAISRRKARKGKVDPKLGEWKMSLVEKYLGEHAYLATGYMDWALGPKTEKVKFAELERLAEDTADTFKRWYEAETKGVLNG